MLSMLQAENLAHKKPWQDRETAVSVSMPGVPGAIHGTDGNDLPGFTFASDDMV